MTLSSRLIPEYAVDVPSPIAEANDRARAAAEAADRAVEACRAAQAEARRAPTEDEEADFRAGTNLAKPTAPAKREAADAAGRVATITRRQTAQALDELAVAVTANQRAWIEAQHPVVDAAESRVGALADELAEAFDDLARQGAILDALYRWDTKSKARRSLRFDRRRVVGQKSPSVNRPDGSRRQINTPVQPAPDKIVPALRDVAAAFNREPGRTLIEERDNPTPPTEAQLDLHRRQKAMAELAAGGVHVGSGDRQ